VNIPQRLLPYLKPHRLRFYYAVLAMCAVALINGGSVLLLKPIVDRVFIAKDLNILLLAVAGVPMLVLVKTIASYVQNYMMSWIGQSVTQRIREDLFRRLHRLPIDFYDQHHSGEILSRVTSDLTMVQSALTSIPLYLIRDTMTVAVLTCSLFYLDWRFALLSLLVMPLSLTALFVLSGKMRQSSLQSQALMDRLCECFEESVRAMLIIKAFNYEERAIEKFQDENASFFASIMRYLRATALAAPLMEMAGSIIVAVIIYFGGREVILGHMTPGAFFAFLGAFISAYAPIKNLARSNSELQRALACGERIFQLLDEPPRGSAKARGVPFDGLHSRILLDDVGFRYSGVKNNVLRGLSFEIAKGDHTVLVGPSGAGKTTLLRLLMLLHRPAEGRLLFDARDAASIEPRSLRARVGLLTQETILFNDTIFGNVALSSRSATPQQVELACRAAGIADLVAALPKGYETMLGDHGLPLTPSQRQKIALARIALKDPPIILLDQATAGLDATDEGEFLRILETLLPGRTVLFVAHKLQALPRRHRILVMDNGALVESGDHKTLLAGNGLYRRLYDLERSEPAAQS
jgi:subfamily B ATP-binding cassette protein MsbA